jgi:hypothetical protein
MRVVTQEMKKIDKVWLCSRRQNEGNITVEYCGLLSEKRNQHLLKFPHTFPYMESVDHATW